MNNSKFRFNDGTPNDTLDYVKGIMPLLGDIKAFKIFNNYFTPYDNEIYNFFLKDVNGNELWLDTLSGSAEVGIKNTRAILQLLGIKEDYDIKANGFLNEENIRPVHKLNILLTKPVSAAKTDPLFWVQTNFTSAYQLYNLKNILNLLGCYEPVNKNQSNVVPNHLQQDAFSNELDDYATNMALVLNGDTSKFDHNTLKIIIKNAVIENGGELEFISI